MYVDSAKTYAGLSAGGLAVGAAFAEKILQQSNWLNPGQWLFWGSTLFMLALLLIPVSVHDEPKCGML
jgi:hypothetical protein